MLMYINFLFSHTEESDCRLVFRLPSEKLKQRTTWVTMWSPNFEIFMTDREHDATPASCAVYCIVRFRTWNEITRESKLLLSQ